MIIEYAKVPEDRFERIQKFADALDEAVQPQPITVVLSPPIEASNTAPLIPAKPVSGLASGGNPEALTATPANNDEQRRI